MYTQKKLITILKIIIKMRAFDAVILKSKLQEFLIESKRNIETKMKKINSVLYLMREENDQIITKGKFNLNYIL